MAEEFNLSIYNDVYDMSFNQDTEEIHIELKEGYYPLSNNVDVSNYYNKPQSDARYKPISYTPTWSEVSGKPTTFAPLAHTHTISEVINLQSTLANKVDKLNAVNLGEILDTQLSIKMTPSADDEIVILDSITGDAATVKFSSFGGNVDLSNYYTKPQSDSRYKSINYVPSWGSIGGDIENQTDLIQKFGNYYIKTETYNKNEVNSLISNIDVDLSNYYNKSESDSRYKSINYVPTWSEVSGKPTAFTPSAHTHTISEVTNLQTTLDNKVDKVTGKQLSTEDYTTSEKNKLAGIQEGAEVNVNADWNATSGDAQILNKPSTFTPSAHTHTIAEIDNLQNTLDGKEQKISTGTTSQYWRGDKTWQTLDKNAVGLSNVDNTSDANKPISNATQTALNNKQDVLTEDNVGSFMDLELSTKSAPTSGDTVLARDILTNKAVEIPIESLGGGGSGLALGETSSTAYRGDRGKIAYDHSQVTHDKTLVGLGNVDNTSDLNKPISTATQTALDLKENVANKATDLSSPNNNKYPTTLAVVNETKKATITVELISQLTTNFYAPNALRINSTALISGSGTLTLKVNDVAYTLTDLIPQGAKITAETTSSSVYNLISIYE